MLVYHCPRTLGVGKNIDSSMHCDIFFPNSISIIKSSESIQASDHPRALAGPLCPRLQQLEASRPRPSSRVGGWCIVNTPSALWRLVADVWHTALSETVNSQRSRSHPGCCTVRESRGSFSYGQYGQPPRVAFVEGSMSAIKNKSKNSAYIIFVNLFALMSSGFCIAYL